MAVDLGGSQITALLESVPGIANVLRSAVADALVNMIRAGAEIGPFHNEDAEELVQYAVRRGLIGSREGDEVMADVRASAKGKSRPPRPKKKLPKPAPRGPFGRPAKKPVVVVKGPSPGAGEAGDGEEGAEQEVIGEEDAGQEGVPLQEALDRKALNQGAESIGRLRE